MVLIALSAPSFADISESDLGDLKGYTILGSYEVTGWRDPDMDGMEGSSFKGCKRNRVLILDRHLEVICSDYGYVYAYRPTAVILSNGVSLKMVVEGHVFSIRQ